MKFWTKIFYGIRLLNTVPGSIATLESSRAKFRLQWEGPKNTFKRLFLAVGCYNFLLKPYLKNFRKFSNTPSVPKCPKFKTLISVLENEKSVNLKNRFSHYSSRMVFITYFFNAFEFFAEKIWGYLSSSRAFFGSVKALFETFQEEFDSGTIPRGWLL